MASEFKCSVHGLTRENTCNWCGQPICKQCIEASYMRKYCTRCYTKLSKGSFAKYLDKQWGEKPKERLFNIDPMLTDEEIEKKKQMLEIKEKAKKIMGEH